jgi:CO/xanthine dehydrogenase FAD-binding subunit
MTEEFRDAAELAVEAAAPISDVRAGERYRRAQIPVVVRRALERALERARR